MHACTEYVLAVRDILQSLASVASMENMRAVVSKLHGAPGKAPDSLLLRCLDDFGWSEANGGFADLASIDPARLKEALEKACPLQRRQQQPNK